ncbi:MAG: hypothetical protein HY318_03745 [Armatimonadetes bacterium]|nr:hypothetical protein [Armatimonadota bacterium]
MSEEQGTSATPSGTSQTSGPAKRKLSPFGAMIAMILGAVIGIAAYSVVDKKEDEEFVRTSKEYVKENLKDAGPMMDGVIESMQSNNYGEAKSKLEDVLTVCQRAQKVVGDEEERTRLDDLISGIGIAMDGLGNLAENTKDSVDAVATKMRDMGIDVHLDVNQTAPQPGSGTPQPGPESGAGTAPTEGGAATAPSTTAPAPGTGETPPAAGDGEQSPGGATEGSSGTPPPPIPPAASR